MTKIKNPLASTMISQKEKKVLTSLLVGLILFIMPEPAFTQQPGIRRTELQRYDLSARGREAIQVRIDFDRGTEFGNHSHPGEEIIYVLEGLLEYKVDGKPPVTLKAGEVLFVPARTIHSAKNVGNGNASELATYIVEKGKPLLVLDK